jgi:peptidoglycan/xylan/chitin deacetylase (PgdA/CDA1 family)
LVGACLVLASVGVSAGAPAPVSNLTEATQPAAPPAETGRLGTFRTWTLPREAAAWGRRQHQPLPLGPRELVLTFDDGPRPGSTPRILATLAEHGVLATFFMVGQALHAHPELARQVRAAGHSVALHSWGHPALNQLSDSAQAAELQQALAAFERTFGGPPPAYRFPFLAVAPATMAALAAQRIAVFSADAGAEDWLPQQTPQMLTERLMKQLDEAGGGIVLLHDAQDQTAEALPLMLRTLKAQGWRVVHLRWP